MKFADRYYFNLRGSSLSVSPDSSRLLALSVYLASLDPAPQLLAERLLRRFGTISAIAEASELELRQVSHGSGQWIEPFVVVRDLLGRGSQEKLLGSKLNSLNGNLQQSLLNSMRSLRTERMIAIFADSERLIISHEIVGEGEKHELALSLRRLFARALLLDARWMVLAHNHPSGSAEPSGQDIRNTEILGRHAQSLGIGLDDHLIVGRFKVTSMRQRGLL